MGIWFTWVYGGGCAAVAILATVCTATVTPHRTYYPLLRLIFAVIAGVYGALAAGQYWYPEHNPLLRIVAIVAALGLLLACVAFIWRRNRVPQWITNDVHHLAGPETIDFATIDSSLLNSLSLLRHGVASPETVAQFRAALARWDELAEGKRSLRAQLEARRAARRAGQGDG